MKSSRRDFLKSTFGAGILAMASGCFRQADRPKTTISQLDDTAAAPVLKTGFFISPVKIALVELLRNGNNLFARATPTDLFPLA
ncbi:unnamed protein product [marine sediment metagenome]|uniref:Twin-arginine translocation signal domain-containing protein n=1 Tax=marine sediment metagenome TaxID=412755 RepID=X1T888_9ZZZZ